MCELAYNGVIPLLPDRTFAKINCLPATTFTQLYSHIVLTPAI